MVAKSSGRWQGRLVQFLDGKGRRRVGVPSDDGGALRIVRGTATTLGLVTAAMRSKRRLLDVVSGALSSAEDDYDAVCRERRLLPPIDHPDPAHLMVSGTGLTHLGSASARDAMHDGDSEKMTDSMKMFRMGIEGGKPAGGRPGVQPEWFYKGDGSIVVPPERPLPSPAFALDGSEEPELVGIYLVGADGRPWRLGFALGNEFSDHAMERRNYLYLAHSKLRACSFGPEIRLGRLTADLRGMSRVLRAGKAIWEKPFLTGEANMSHWIRNLEFHHFKYAQFRRPGDVHIHFFGTATLSYADGVATRPGDVFEISLPGFGRPLRNPLAVARIPRTRVIMIR